MAILPLNIARVSNLLSSSVTAQSIESTQQQLLDLQNQLSTGKRLNLPSDDPGDAAVAMQLNKTLQQRQAYSANLTSANSQLSEVDSTMGDLTDLLQQAQTIASQNVGTDVSAGSRQSAAAVVDSLYNQALTIANRQFNGAYLFGGDKSTDAPYASTSNGVEFTGSTQQLQNRWDDGYATTFTVGGQAIFSNGSGTIVGSADLTPGIDATTRLSDLRGALGTGVQRGSIKIGNGTSTVLVDLSQAQSIGDVINDINGAGLPGVSASIGTDGHSLALTASGSQTISVNDISNGTTARDLGILQPAAGAAGALLAGGNVNANVTVLTSIASLRDGAGLDPTGFTINNGSSTATIDLAGVNTVQDLLNKINSSNVGVRASIDADGKSLDITNLTQGTNVTVSENGGTTASQLGLRTLTPNTALAGLNGGKGVGTVSGGDFQITRSDGTQFVVSIAGAATIQDVIDDINTADAGGGMTASFAATGNGIVLTDSVGGGGQIALSLVNASMAANDLGLLAQPVGNTITSNDTNPLQAGGIFANLNALRTALETNNSAGITSAAEGLQSDQNRVVVARGTNGAKLQEIQSRRSNLDDQNVATETLLSNIQDTDFTTAITEFQTLQTALQAGLKVGATTMNLSLLDYLS